MIPSAGKILREVLDPRDLALWSYDLTDQTLYLSPGYYGILGYQPGDFPPTLETWIELIHPEEMPRVVDLFQKFLRTGTGELTAEYRLKTFNGGWRWVSSRAKVVDRDPGGNPVRISGINVEITQKKLMEKALKESEGRWTGLVDEAPVGISLISREGLVYFANRYENAGHETEPLGRNWKDFLPAELHPLADRVLDEGFRLGKPSIFRTYRPQTDGDRRYFENHTSPMAEDGVIRALLVVSVDVTVQEQVERRKARISRRMECLLSLHAQLQAGCDSLAGSALEASLELTGSRTGFVILYSEADRRFTHRVGNPSPGTGCGEPGTRTTLNLGTAGFLREVVTSRQPRLYDHAEVAPHLRFLFGNPGPPDLRMALVPVLEDRSVVAVIGVGDKATAYNGDDLEELKVVADSFWQLTRRVETEESFSNLFQAVEHSPSAMVLTDSQGSVEYANPKFLAPSGLDVKDLLGRPHFGMGQEFGESPVCQELLNHVRAGSDWQGEWMVLDGSNRTRTELISVSPIFNFGNKLTHMFMVKEDVTELKVARDMLFQAQKMETIGQLAAGVAHDFNNLMTSILAFNQMLLRKIEPGAPLRLFPERHRNSRPEGRGPGDRSTFHRPAATARQGASRPQQAAEGRDPAFGGPGPHVHGL